MIKVAFSGKGGVGKTTLAGLFIQTLAKEGQRVLAVDCDPVANLGRFLKVENADSIVPIAEMKDLIQERMEVGPDRTLYKLNPQVDDIPERFSLRKENIRLMVMGTVRQGGAGCMCAEAGFLKALLSRLLLREDEAVVMDMEAGVEHLGRATAASVDELFIVLEPTPDSISAAKKIARLAEDLKIKKISPVLNKVRDNTEVALVAKEILPLDLIACIPFEEEFLRLGMAQDDIDLEKTRVYSAVLAMRDKMLVKW